MPFSWHSKGTDDNEVSKQEDQLNTTKANSSDIWVKDNVEILHSVVQAAKNSSQWWISLGYNENYCEL